MKEEAEKAALELIIIEELKANVVESTVDLLTIVDKELKEKNENKVEEPKLEWTEEEKKDNSKVE